MGGTVLVSMVITIGAYNLLSMLITAPSRKSILAVKKTLRADRRQKGMAELFYACLVNPAAEWVAPLIKLDGYKKAVVERRLKKARRNVSAERHYARCLVFSLYILLAACVFLLIGAVFVFAVLALLSVLMYFKNAAEPAENEKKQNQLILKELPQLVSTIEHSLKTGSDVIDMFDKYRIVAGPAFMYDLDILLSDFRLGNQADALKKFEDRLGMQEVTEFVSALIGIIHGTSQADYLRILLSEMRIMQREQIRREIENRPRKIKPFIILIMLGAMALIFTPVITDLMVNLSIFG